MSTRCVLCLLLPVLGSPTLAQDEDAVTAKAKIDSVEMAARAVAADAELIFVFSPVDVSTTGTSPQWAYVFQSVQNSELYEFHYGPNGVIRSPALSFSDPFVHVGLDPLPDDWIDSDAAVQAAHNAGGNLFMQQSPEFHIEARLYASGDSDSPRPHRYFVAPLWEVRYENPLGQMEQLIHSLSGSPRRAVAFDWYADALRESAGAAVAEPQLVAVFGELVGPTGRSWDWTAVFKSAVDDALVGVHFRDYRLSGEIDVGFNDEEHWKHALPLPEGVVPIQTAMTTAESRGGSVFRQSHPGTRCDVHLEVGDPVRGFVEYAQNVPAVPLWNIMYSSGGMATEQTISRAHAKGDAPNLVRPGAEAPERAASKRAPEAAHVPQADLRIMIDALTGLLFDDLLSNLQPTTAESALVLADSAVADFDPDAELLHIATPFASASGLSPYWIYSYRSALSEKPVSYYVISYEDRPAARLMHQELAFLHGGLPALPANWVDSDVAMAEAEAVKGETFRAAHPEANANLHLVYLQDALPVERPTWVVTYESNTGAYDRVDVDALLGASYGNLPRYRAKAKLADVVALARASYPDAKLSRLASARVTSEGAARRWKYQFITAGSDTLRDFWSIGGLLFQSTDPYNVDVIPDAVALPDGWLDSDSAMAVAESLGGAQYRLEHDNAHSSMDLHALKETYQKRQAPMGTRVMWNVYYGAPDGSGEHFAIDGGYFATFVTAGTLLGAVNREAEALADDAELISVSAWNIDLDGKQELWFYTYQSAGRGELYQYVVEDGAWRQLDEVRQLDDSIYLGATPLPPRWADSDLAVEIAEQEGGSTFRAQHPNAEISARMFTPPERSSQWEIVYQADGNLAIYVVDALTNVASEQSPGTPPRAWALHPNYPNPFQTSTTISFDVPHASRVLLRVYDVLGRTVATLLDRDFLPGTSSVVWDATGLAPGTYFCRLSADGSTHTVKTHPILVTR